MSLILSNFDIFFYHHYTPLQFPNTTTTSSKMARRWVLTGQEGFETSLEYQQDVKIPSPHELGSHDVLVRMHAASLNYRELVIAGPMVWHQWTNHATVIPGCDGAGIVEGVGSSVHDFHVGDRVLTHVSAKFVESHGDDALPGIANAAACLGQGSDVGAIVIATTSSEEKAARLKTLGATHVINYLANPKGWGEEARGLTPGGRGVDFVIDVGGNETLPNSLVAVRVDGIVLVVGQVGESSVNAVPMFAALLHTCIVRGILAASRNQFRELVRFIDEYEIVPAVDDVVFKLAEVKSVYRRLKEKKHFAKVLIEID
ncbi:hypothetical protein VN97_g10772 [Penicillium thymicola]|uniref:Enoyl reductase (ER) domain-containing protein n=1 Tax=Penicillium thymicola TaxID=293382 RepID=A0AAI9T9F9_PENTH|nr:hypothetical protein VN97_g10772 [Penicillium thymicola]